MFRVAITFIGQWEKYYGNKCSQKDVSKKNNKKVKEKQTHKRQTNFSY